MVHYFGGHYDTDDIIESLIQIKNDGGDIVQIFITNQKDRYSNKKIEVCRKYMEKHNSAIVIHSSYTHNIARGWDEYSWWIDSIINEIKQTYKLSGLGIVLHFGKKLDLTIEEAFNNMYTSLVHIHQRTQKYKSVKIFLETSSGQGTETCYDLKELAKFYNKIVRIPALKERIKICVDTCHIFVAGYDIRTVSGVSKYLDQFDKLVGISNIGLIHLNDSAVQLGEKKDRHQSIGKGYIGYTGLKYFFDYFKKLSTPIILETPSHNYKKDISLLSKNNIKK